MVILRVHTLRAVSITPSVFSTICLVQLEGSPLEHNEVRDITASLLSEACYGVSTEPHQQLLPGESMSHHSAIVDNGVCLDSAVYGFWEDRFERGVPDVRMFNPWA